MLATVEAYLTNAFVVGVIGLVCGMLFGQKIKDWLTGVPNGFRAAMTGLENKARDDVSAAVADVFAKITPVATKPPTSGL